MSLKKLLVVLAHPNGKSFTHALADEVGRVAESLGMDVRMRDLYASGFDPVLGPKDFEMLSQKKLPPAIEEGQADVNWADAMVFLYPVWWYAPPAILKGWFDRVFQYGYAFEARPGGGYNGLLRSKKAWVIATNGNTREEYGEEDPAPMLYGAVVKGTLEFCGVETRLLPFYGVGKVTDEQRKEILGQVGQEAELFLQSRY